MLKVTVIFIVKQEDGFGKTGVKKIEIAKV
jgi:hypothetical protein